MGRVELVRLLLDHGAEINYYHEQGLSALLEACWKGHEGVVTLLLQRGADVNMTNHRGQLALMRLIVTGHRNIVRLLCEHGATDLDATDTVGNTVVHVACYKGKHTALQQLLDAGADPTVPPERGQTALDIARRGKEYPECVTVLEDWHRAYTLRKARAIHDACVFIVSSAAPVDAAPAFLTARAAAADVMSSVHVESVVNHQQQQQQHGPGPAYAGEEQAAQDQYASTGSMVIAYAVEEVQAELFVELMAVLGIPGGLPQ